MGLRGAIGAPFFWQDSCLPLLESEAPAGRLHVKPLLDVNLEL